MLEVKHFGNDQETKPHIKVKTALQTLLFFFFSCEMVKEAFGKQVGMAKREQMLAEEATVQVPARTTK